MKKTNIFVAMIALPIALIACASNNSKGNKETAQTDTKPQIEVPSFNADSAYQFIEDQVAFGPRVPNMQSHEACATYLTEKLNSFGATVYTQKFDAIAFDGTILKSTNIIGAYKPESKKRVALFAHWDTRLWADNDKNKENINKPILGANDGASGVGVLLEIARNLQLQEPTIGIDIILFDSEDYGAPQHYKGRTKEEDWCLGSQYWSRIPHVDNYRARYGILLDMVGGKDATFYYEGYSKYYASKILTKVWDKGIELGYGKHFLKRDGGAIIDDHMFVNQIAKIPTIDIIPFYPHNEDSSFGSTWHTIKDDMSDIDKETLKAVGQTVTAIIYNEQ